MTSQTGTVSPKPFLDSISGQIRLTKSPSATLSLAVATQTTGDGFRDFSNAHRNGFNAKIERLNHSMIRGRVDMNSKRNAGFGDTLTGFVCPHFSGELALYLTTIGGANCG
jgi:hypothetical protein